jgi:hypothetical protein
MGHGTKNHYADEDQQQFSNQSVMTWKSPVGAVGQVRDSRQPVRKRARSRGTPTVGIRRQATISEDKVN